MGGKSNKALREQNGSSRKRKPKKFNEFAYKKKKSSKPVLEEKFNKNTINDYLDDFE